MRLYLAFFLALTSLNSGYCQNTGQTQGDKQNDQNTGQTQGDKQNDQSRAVYQQLSGLGPGQTGFFISDVGYTAPEFQPRLPAIPSSVASLSAAAPSNGQLPGSRTPPRQQANTQDQHRFQLGSYQRSPQEHEPHNIANQHQQQPQSNQYNQQSQYYQYNQQPQQNQYNREPYQQYNHDYQSMNRQNYQQLSPPTQTQPQAQSTSSLNRPLGDQYNQLNQRQQSYQLLSNYAQQRQSLQPSQQQQQLSPAYQRQPSSVPQQYPTLSNANTVNQHNNFNNQPTISYFSDRSRLPSQEKIQWVSQFPPQVTLTKPLQALEPVVIDEDNKKENVLSTNQHEEKPTQIFNVEDDKSQTPMPEGNNLIQYQFPSQTGPKNLRLQGTSTLNQPHHVNHEQRVHEKQNTNNFEDKIEQHQLNKQNHEENLKEFLNFGMRQRKTNRNQKNEGPIHIQKYRGRGHQRQQIVSTESPSVDEQPKNEISFHTDSRDRVKNIPEGHIQRIHQGNNNSPDKGNDFREEQLLKHINHPTPLFSNLKETQREQQNSFRSQDHNDQSIEGNKNENKHVSGNDNSLNRSPESTPVNTSTGRRRVKVARQRQRVVHEIKDENNNEAPVRHVPNYPKESLSKIISEDKEEIKSPEEVAHSQAVNAKYSFQSSFNDTIHDNSQMRQEVRDGLKIKGQYSYSDGFFMRTVHYVADENGYRVIKELSEPIGDGPIHDPEGQVDLKSSRDGRGYKYSVSARDIPIMRSQEQPLDIDVRFGNQKPIINS